MNVESDRMSAGYWKLVPATPGMMSSTGVEGDARGGPYVVRCTVEPVSSWMSAEVLFVFQSIVGAAMMSMGMLFQVEVVSAQAKTINGQSINGSGQLSLGRLVLHSHRLHRLAGFSKSFQTALHM